MIDYAGALFLVIGFIVILKIAGLVERSTRVIAISKQAVAVLRDEDMSDDEKENLMQSHAKQLAGLFFLLTIGGLAAVFLPFALIWAFDQAGLISVDSVLAVALSWPFITVTTVVIIIAIVVSRKR
ncbi:MAG TPA: hypothetical protein VLA11_05540 [Woeseiaceae bacterium]|nr:hypothetical protein [Woeseiaceae bacterium]